jgi:hypothetical protein
MPRDIYDATVGGPSVIVDLTIVDGSVTCVDAGGGTATSTAGASTPTPDDGDGATPTATVAGSVRPPSNLPTAGGGAGSDTLPLTLSVLAMIASAGLIVASSAWSARRTNDE